jgi:CDP-paratose 2-epimerase
MKVMVTGGCGFLGSHVCQFYRERGDAVISYDSMTKYELNRVGYGAEKARSYNWEYLQGLGVELVKEDIRNFDQLRQHAEGVDFIIHTAAQPAMTISIEDPELDFSTNVRGTFNVLKVARELKVPMVSCGTVHIYGNKINETLTEGKTRYLREPVAIDEGHRVVEGTLTPLHASKRAAELYLETYIHSYKLHAASFRLTGLYGPRQFGGEDHGWVANFAIRALIGRPLRIFGTGKQVRDIIYPIDVAKAFHAFYERGEPGIYNIGGGPEYGISLLECIDLIGDILGKKPGVQFEEIRLGDLLYFICDIQKARKILKWEPSVPPKQGVRNLIEWLRQNESLFRKDIA